MSLRHRHKLAFTLIEVMISIFLVLLLMIGINQAFKITAQTVNAGHAVSNTVRDSVAAQSVLTSEVGHAMVTNPEEMPFLIIDSRTQPAFRNKPDQLTDRDFDP